LDVSIISKKIFAEKNGKCLGNENEWRQELFKYIDADQMPVHYGGTKTGETVDDKKCVHKVGKCFTGILKF
jgi:hypothetical protein